MSEPTQARCDVCRKPKWEYSGPARNPETHCAAGFGWCPDDHMAEHWRLGFERLAAEAAPLREEIEMLKAQADRDSREIDALDVNGERAEAKVERLTKERDEVNRQLGLAHTTSNLLSLEANDNMRRAMAAEAKVLSLEAERDEERQHANEWLAQLHDAKRDALAAASRAREEQGALRAALEAADRLITGVYRDWETSGGPDVCEHGYAAGIPCERCDHATFNAALAPPAAESQENQQQLTWKGQ